MLRIIAMIIGILFILSGVFGFMPEFVQEGKLFGYFAINTMRNFLHLAIGFLGLFSGIKGAAASKIYFIIFGVLFLIMAALGFYHNTGVVFDYVVANNADNWLYGALAVLFLYIGISYFRKKK
ncbi:MAG: DUF4383 domain-containing protein [Parachlamydiaceae bacterium]|nr:DUF4383 domain-containing protein [Parachlamydiaceae bacterium]